MILSLAVAAGLGLLVGLQREWAAQDVAGIRTFALISLLGCTAGLVVPVTPLAIPAGLLGLSVLLLLGGAYAVRVAEPDPGLTTEVAVLLVFMVGVLVGLGHHLPGIVLGGTVALLLQWKRPLHALVRSLREGDLRAIFQFVLVALVILPLLPDQAFGPYGVLNPFRIWLMVVLIVGISIASYVGYRVVGGGAGTLVAGLLGGMISSTATTVSYARQARTRSEVSRAAAVVVVLASVVMFVRVTVEIALVAPAALGEMAPPLIVMGSGLALASAVLWIRGRSGEEGSLEEPEPPSELRTAITFGLLYALVLLGVATAREHLGPTALYVVAAISGLTDMDAITLSTSQLVRGGRLDPATGWRLILVGGMANLAFKGAVVGLVAGGRLLRPVAAAFGTAIALGAGLILLWPG